MANDLNLLRALRVLLEERNVTRAAKRLFISQPAMSKSLHKLRQEFDDPLFTRTAYGLSPTPRAKQLEQQLPKLLDQLNALVRPEQFAPANHRQQFRLSSSDIFYRQFLPKLMPEFARQAPHSGIRAGEVEKDFLEQLANGQLDFAIHTNRQLSEDFVATHLGFSQSFCLMREGHPLCQQPQISLDDYLRYPHIRLYLAQITEADIGVIDEILIRQGKRRKIILESASVAIATQAVANSDALMVAPVAIIKDSMQALTYLPLPAEVDFPKLETVLIQHRRSLGSPAHQWLKQMIVAIMKPAMAEAL